MKKVSIDCNSAVSAEPKQPVSLNAGGYAISAIKITNGSLLNKPIRRQTEKSDFLLKLERQQAEAAKQASVVRQMNHYRKNR